MDPNKRKDILRQHLLLSETDTIERFKELITKSKSLFRIDGKNGSVVFERNDFNNAEKISLLLVGRYFAKELSLIENTEMTSNELSDSLQIIQTTISAPLGQLTSSGYLDKSDGKYSIKHFKIEEILDSLISKFKDRKETIKSGFSLKGLSAAKKLKKQKDINKNKSSKKQAKEKYDKYGIDLSSIQVTASPEGINDLANDLGVTNDELNVVFDCKDGKVTLAKKRHDDKESEEAFINTVIFLTGHFYNTYRRDISTKELMPQLRNANVSINNKYARDMKNTNRRMFILRKDDGYKITDTGVKLGIGLIKQILGR